MPRRNISQGLNKSGEILPRPVAGVDAAMTGFEAVASYTWLDRTSPTILVPGGLPVYKENLPCTVPADAGNSFIDQNADRLPRSSPLEPLIRSVQLLRPDFDFKVIDLVTDRNNLRKLLRWVSRSGDNRKPFRIDIEMAGGTMFFRRWEKSDLDQFKGYKGYGKEFKRAQTWLPDGLEDAKGHHRIVTYSLGELRLLVRFEVNAQLPTPLATSTDVLLPLVTPPTADLATSSRLPTRCPPPTFLSYQIGSSLTLVPQPALVEIKTTHFKSSFPLREFFPQLFFSQTPHLYLAKHDTGRFPAERLRKLQLDSGSLAEEARKAEADLGRVVAFLEQVMRLAATMCDGTKGKEMTLAFDGLHMRVFSSRKGLRSLHQDLVNLFI